MERFGRWRDVLRDLDADQPRAIETREGELRRWELGPLQTVDPSRLLRDEHDLVGRLFLALAVAFNDLKGVVMFDGYLADYGVPPADPLTPELGQWRGLQTQAHRWIAGTLFELMILLVDRDSRIAFGLPEFEAVLARVDEATRATWAELREDATIEHAPQAHRGRSLLYRLRNSSAFHYNATELARSYRAIVAEGASSPETQRAMYSYGPDMDGTRFYYADAAAQRLFLSLAQDRSTEPTDRALITIARQVNEALAPLIAAFIQHRST